MTHFLADDGEPIHVEVSGQGTPLVMLHGWTADRSEWDAFREQLSRRHRLILWDARGHGAQPMRGTTAPTLARMARDLHQLFEHFDLTEVTLVGHSMGALTAWEYIRQFGCHKLARLCLIDQSPKLLTDAEWRLGIYGDFDAARSARFLEGLRSDFVETVLRLSAHGLNQRARRGFEENTRGWQRERERVANIHPHAMIAAWESIIQSDYRALLPTIEVPTWLLYGDQSNFYPLETAHYVHRNMPNAQLAIYDNTDHCPHLWQPSRFLADLAAFTDSAA